MISAIQALNRLELVGETLHHALEVLAVAAPDWLRPHLEPARIERYGRRSEDYRLLQTAIARDALATTIGVHGWRLQNALTAPVAPACRSDRPAVASLLDIWEQFY